MKHKALLVATMLTSTLAPLVSSAQATGGEQENSTYFKRSSEGWFWYKKDPEPAKPEPPQEPVAVAPPPPQQVQPVAPPKDVEPQQATSGPPPGSTAWLRAAIPAALDAATDNPTPENVERYFLLQKEAMDKSEVFAEIASFVTTGHPELDEGRRRPRQDQFAKMLEEEASKQETEVLKRLFKRAALIIFVDRNCSGCALMAENFYRMQTTHGLVWEAISLDGALLPDTLSDSQSFDNGIADKLGVNQGGAVFLVRPPDLYVPVTWNATGGSEVASRILMVAYRNGMISQDEYRASQPINPMVGGPFTPAPTETPNILREADELLTSRGQRVVNR